MNTIRTILKNKNSAEVWSVAPNDSVLDAVTLMAKLGIGALLVMEGERLAGIVSERDYARKIILQGRRSEDTAVKEIMTSDVLVATREMTAQHCLGMMTEGHFRHLPVVEEGRVVGLVSIGDLVKCVIDDQQVVIRELEKYVTG
ncbi:MAG TPA: CBS domain-containing protein [Gammaproteobacteria bacterium]|nr:CBS domain-containing protein [Gammaproteobacteria bacterium]